MSYVVDTDILSQTSPTTTRPIPGLSDWLDRNSDRLHLSAVSLMEISYGIAWLRHRGATRKSTLLQAWLEDLIVFHEPHIIMVGNDVAVHAGVLLARARAGGTEVDTEDALIAATADLNAMTVLTANARHFAPMRVRYADPLTGLPPDG
jgi:toxin FitB